MKILLKGYYGFGNLGDDILMLTSYRLLKKLYPEAEIMVFSNNSPNNLDALYPAGYNDYIKAMLKDDIKIIDWTYKGYFDLVIDGGGGVYFDNQQGPVYYYPINQIIGLIGSQGVLRIDSALRKITGRFRHIEFGKRIGLGIGVGPFHPSARQYYKNIVEIACYDQLFVRDQLSYELVKSLGIKGQLILATDLAFLTEYWLEKDLSADISNDRHIAVILKGQTPSLYSHYKELARKLEKNNYQVTFFAFDEYFDRMFIKHMAPEYKVEVWQPYEQDIIEFLRKLWACGLCLTDRAHGAILGALGFTLPLIIRTTQKSDQIVNLLQLNKIMPSYSDSTFYQFEDIENVLESKEMHLSKLKNRLTGLQTEMAEKINALLK